MLRQKQASSVFAQVGTESENKNNEKAIQSVKTQMDPGKTKRRCMWVEMMAGAEDFWTS